MRPRFPIKEDRKVITHGDKLIPLEHHNDIIIGNRLIFPRNKHRAHWLFSEPYYMQYVGDCSELVILEEVKSHE